MTLEQLFNNIPIHSKLSLSVVGDEGRGVEDYIEAKAWCDDAMPREFEQYSRYEVYDITPESERGGICISVMHKDKIDTDDDLYYLSESGRRYNIVKFSDPISGAEYDIGALMENREDGKVIAWFYGISEYAGGRGLRNERGLRRLCREYVTRWEQRGERDV